MDNVEGADTTGMPPLHDGNSLFDDQIHPTVELDRGIDVEALMSEKGTEFSIKDGDVDVTNADDWEIATGDSDDEYEEPLHVKESLQSATDREKGDGTNTPFQRLAKTMKDITADSSGKVKKKILRAGVGPLVPERSIVRVFYSGRLEYSDEPFDSTYLQSRDRPRSFKLGDGILLPGLDLAVSTMRREEICLVLIDPDYFMGPLGCPPRVPPNATVLFRIELVSFSDRSGVHDYYDLPMSERKNAPLETILQVSKIERDEGKKLFKERRFRQAFSRYRKAANMVEDCRLVDAEAEAKQQAELLIIYRNAAVCANRLSEPNSTIAFANKALRVDDQDSKAWYLRGKGLTQQSEFDSARHAYMKAKNLKPNDPEIAKALQELNSKFKQFSMTEAATYKKMFPTAKNSDKSDSQPDTKPKVNQSNDPLLEVSEDFRRDARAQLTMFKESKDATDLPFPSLRLTQGEIECLIYIAEDIGLSVQEVGKGSNHHYRFCKPKDT